MLAFFYYMKTTIEIKADCKEVSAAISELNVYLDRLADLPHGPRKLALALVDAPSEVVRLEVSAASTF